MTISTRSSRKRARVDSDTEEQENDNPTLKVDEHSDSITLPVDGADPQDEMGTLERDEEFWFDDGTVILVAQGTRFCVYSGLLARHSPVFKDLLTRSQRFASIQHHQQNIPCPVVVLSDHPSCLRHVLRALMPGPEQLLSRGVVTAHFATISAYIRLGRKYQLSALCGMALKFLKFHFPNTPTLWINSRCFVPKRWDPLEAIGVINLARAIDEPSLLPTAFLVCTFIVSPGSLLAGFVREDGERETLASSDLALCFAARPSITSATVEALQTAAKSFLKSPRCARCRNPICNVFHTLDVGKFIDVADVFPNPPFTLGDNHGFCKTCINLLSDQCQKENRKVWNQLPELIGIEVPGWVPATPSS